MAILESVRELASKLGAETNGRDVTDQINKINKHLDETALGGRDIAEAVRTYSKNASGGGGGGETFEFSVTVTAEMTGEIENPATLASDKTYSEIVSAFNNGDKLIPTITINAIRDGQTYTSILTVALCTVTELGLWICGYEDFDSGINSIMWLGNTTTGALQSTEANYIFIG